MPALRARALGELEYARDLLISVIAERLGRDRESFEIRLGSAMLVTGIWEAGMTWVRSGGVADYVVLINQALDIVERGARLD